MIKNWVVKYFAGGYLKTWYPATTKSHAMAMMECMTDGHCIEAIDGIFKGKVIYRYPKTRSKPQILFRQPVKIAKRILRNLKQAWEKLTNV